MCLSLSLSLCVSCFLSSIRRFFLHCRTLSDLFRTGGLLTLQQVAPKKNGNIRVCVDYRKLNAVTITDAFPLPFTDGVLDAVAGHEMYSFLDGFCGYNQVCMHPEDQEKTAFVTEWGVFVVAVMMFGLKTAPTTFQRIISEVFEEYIPTFVQVFLDDFAVYEMCKDHLHYLRLCLEQCHAARLSLNPAKCAFDVTSGTLLGHIVSKEGIAVDPRKIEAIIKSPTPKNAKQLGRFLGQLRDGVDVSVMTKRKLSYGRHTAESQADLMRET